MRPVVQLVGEIHHLDFEEAVDLLRSQARITVAAELPELIVVAQARPGVIGAGELNALRRAAPLAGIAALLGSWCEGETRTGRPWPGVPRLYWYEFPAWWRRQYTLRAAGRCPDWARPDGTRLSLFGARSTRSESFPTTDRREVVVIQTKVHETASVLADVFARAGYATVCQRRGTTANSIQGAVAGIWEGGQLDEREASELRVLSRQLAADRAPVVAILDFPRRDVVEIARQLGVAEVLAKPWLNRELVDVVTRIVEQGRLARAA